MLVLGVKSGAGGVWTKNLLNFSCNFILQHAAVKENIWQVFQINKITVKTFANYYNFDKFGNPLTKISRIWKSLVQILRFCSA